MTDKQTGERTDVQAVLQDKQQRWRRKTGRANVDLISNEQKNQLLFNNISRKGVDNIDESCHMTNGQWKPFEVCLHFYNADFHVIGQVNTFFCQLSSFTMYVYCRVFFYLFTIEDLFFIGGLIH